MAFAPETRGISRLQQVTLAKDEKMAQTQSGAVQKNSQITQKGNMFSHFILKARKAAASSCCLAVPGAVGLSFYNNYSI